MDKSLIGKVVQGLSISKDKNQFSLTVDGRKRTWEAEGDCCSSSWIEHLEAPADVVGATILDVFDGGAVPHDGHVCKPRYDADYNRLEETCGHGSLSVYNQVIRTDRGDIVLEYRNDSNGYYGGYLTELN